MNELNACYMCDNARINEELTDDNDFSSMPVGSVDNNHRIMFNSGYDRPPQLVFEHWDGKQWLMVGYYKPTFCPNCGRKIIEYATDSSL